MENELSPAGQCIVESFRVAGAITTGVLMLTGATMMTIDAARASLASERLERRNKLYGKHEKDLEKDSDKDDSSDSKSD